MFIKFLFSPNPGGEIQIWDGNLKNHCEDTLDISKKHFVYFFYNQPVFNQLLLRPPKNQATFEAHVSPFAYIYTAFAFFIVFLANV